MGVTKVFFSCWITGSTAILVLEAWMVYVDCYYMKENSKHINPCRLTLVSLCPTLAPKINFRIFGWNFMLQQLLKNLLKIPARPKFRPSCPRFWPAFGTPNLDVCGYPHQNLLGQVFLSSCSRGGVVHLPLAIVSTRASGGCRMWI